MKVTTASTIQSSDSVVEQGPPRRREEDSRHPGDDHDRENRLRAGVDVYLVIVLERHEDLGRVGQDARHEPPPAANVRLRLVGAAERLGVGSHTRLEGLLAHAPSVARLGFARPVRMRDSPGDDHRLPHLQRGE